MNVAEVTETESPTRLEGAKAVPRKPWLTADEQIACLKDKGVSFNIMPEEEALLYLANNNNYFRLGSYRKTFPRYSQGEKRGQFISLDFAMLVDLSVVDLLLRRQMLPMTLDIEHFEKMELMKRIESEHEDGYSIASDYIAQNNLSINGEKTSNRVKQDIVRGSTSPYVKDLIAKYPDFEFPTWAFMEVVAFGTFVDFYKFCAIRFDDKNMRANYYVLQKVRSLRNACAHNNCILNNLAAGTSKHRLPYAVSQAVAGVKGIGSDARKSRLSNDRLQEIATTLFKHRELASPGVHEHRAEELTSFKARMNRHIDYYANNTQISSSFNFLTHLINAWFAIVDAPANRDT